MTARQVADIDRSVNYERRRTLLLTKQLRRREQARQSTEPAFTNAYARRQRSIDDLLQFEQYLLSVILCCENANTERQAA